MFGVAVPGTMYALVVGINDYLAARPLSGCVDDALAFKGFLEGRVEPSALRVRTLLDRHGTRHAVISGFSEHLGKAGAGDVAVFYFAGHGSYETVDERFWFLEPSGRNQTLVCADSRHDGIPDLADKELNELIASVAVAGAHVMVVLDCCHSGSGTRDGLGLSDVHVRQVPPVSRPRLLDSYLPGVRAVVEGIAVQPLARHVALSACEADQFAREMVIGGVYRGVFSAMLQQALQTLGPGATYRDVLAAASVGVRDRVGDQYPVLYAPDADDLDRPVLGGAVRHRRPGIALEHLHGSWWIDAGMVHGVQPSVISGADGNGETTVLAVRRPCPADDPEAAGRPIGRVLVTEVGLTRSQVKPIGGWQPEPGVRYDAVVVDVPLPPVNVELRGLPEGVRLIRDNLAGCAHVTEAQGQQLVGVHFIAAAEAGGLSVARPDGTRITGPFAATAEGAAALAAQLEHLARWHLTRSLDNPLSRLAGQVTIDIVLAGKQEQPRRQGWTPARPGRDGDIRLSYRRTATGWEPPYVFVYIHNRSDRSLYCALLDLTDGFRCHARLFPGDRIPPGGWAVAYEGRPVDVSIPRNRLEAGKTDVRDWFKLIAAEDRFEVGAFELPDLSTASALRPVARQQGTGSTFARLTGRAADRDAGGDAAGASEWSTVLVSVRTVLPAANREPGPEVGDVRGEPY
jgi:hypothetical protein